MPLMTDVQRAGVAAFLAKHTTMTIATVDPDGRPQAADVFFASDDDLKLYWVSDERSRHSQNLGRAERVAASVHQETWDWRDVQGLQIEGWARQIVDPVDAGRAWALFRDKYAFTSAFTDEIAGSRFYVMTPSWLRVIDNSLHFGHHEEFNLP
jgi:uncharacterized protein YhbP (UPF0306 family)